MKMHAALIAAAVLAAPAAFAQVTVQSSTGATVTSGTGIAVTPGVPSSMVLAPGVAGPVIAPVATVAVLPSPTIHGAAVVPAGTQQVVAGPTQTIVTRYWVNVPPGVENDPEFQRWQRLR